MRRSRYSAGEIREWKGYDEKCKAIVLKLDNSAGNAVRRTKNIGTLIQQSDKDGYIILRSIQQNKHNFPILFECGYFDLIRVTAEADPDGSVLEEMAEVLDVAL